jgi:hypothetical protein
VAPGAVYARISKGHLFAYLLQALRPSFHRSLVSRANPWRVRYRSARPRPKAIFFARFRFIQRLLLRFMVKIINYYLIPKAKRCFLEGRAGLL